MTTTLTLDLIREDAEGRETIYEVECGYSVDPGCRMTSNGDGWPPSEDIHIGKVYLDGKEVDVELTEAEIDSLCERLPEAVADAEEAAREAEEDARIEARRERD